MVPSAVVIGTQKAGSRGPGLRVLPPALLCAVIFGALASLGDLRETFWTLVAAEIVLLGAMFAAWFAVRRDRRELRWALGAALLFRVLAAMGEPALSDDVYRYVWDGRVQLHGVHPYRYAPLAPELEPLRDASWARINHPELKTIYPPLAEAGFALAAAAGLGPAGFRIALGVADFLAVLLLLRFLRIEGLPVDRVVLYAWHPLAVLETAGSGHVEPLGLLLLLLAVTEVARRRTGRSMCALAAAIHVKLLPLVLVPGLLRRTGLRGLAVLIVAGIVIWLPYAVTGPPLGGGLADYAERWEHNATVYRVVESALSWVGPVRDVWPREAARMLVALMLVGWIAVVVRARCTLTREMLLVTGGVLVLSPTVHPWYVLWVLPWAAASLSWPWLAFAATVVFSYAAQGDVPGWLRVVEYAPPLALALALALGIGFRARVLR